MNKIIFGIIIPAAVFIFSFVMTYLLYRHFAAHTDNKDN